MTQKPGLARSRSSAQEGEPAARRGGRGDGEGHGPVPSAARRPGPRRPAAPPPAARRAGEGAEEEGGGRAAAPAPTHIWLTSFCRKVGLRQSVSCPETSMPVPSSHLPCPTPPPPPQSRSQAQTRKPSAAPRPRRKRRGACGKWGGARARAQACGKWSPRAPHSAPRSGSPAWPVALLRAGPVSPGRPHQSGRRREAARYLSGCFGDTVYQRFFSICSALPAVASQDGPDPGSLRETFGTSYPTNGSVF